MTPTAKGTFLTVGIALISAGSTATMASVVARPFDVLIFAAGIVLMGLGIGLIFLREKLKEV